MDFVGTTGGTVLQSHQMIESPVDIHAQSQHHGHHQQQHQHNNNGEQVNLPTPEMSPLENSDREGLTSTSSSEDRSTATSKGSPVMQLIYKFGNNTKQYHRSTAPFAHFHSQQPVPVSSSSNNMSLQEQQYLQHQEQQQQQLQQSAAQHYHRQQQQSLQEYFELSHQSPLTQHSMFSHFDPPQYSTSPNGNNGSWLAQEEDRGQFDPNNGYPDHVQHHHHHIQPHYEQFLSQSPVYPSTDANHNSYYHQHQYGLKMESPELLNYDNGSPGGSTNGNSNNTSNNTGNGMNEYENNNNNNNTSNTSSSSLIYKALSEACDGNI